MQPAKVQGIIRGKIPSGLGPYTDVNGKKWDIGAYGKDEKGWWVSATDNVHPYYTSTTTEYWGLVSQKWLPYRLEIC